MVVSKWSTVYYLNKLDDDIGGNVVDVQLYIEETLMGPIQLPAGKIKHACTRLNLTLMNIS